MGATAAHAEVGGGVGGAVGGGAGVGGVGAGGGVGDPAAQSLNRSKLGPDGIPETILGVASFVISSKSCFGVKSLALSNFAATPATCGAAMDVPEMVRVEVAVPIHAAVMSLPGAAMSQQSP